MSLRGRRVPWIGRRREPAPAEPAPAAAPTEAAPPPAEPAAPRLRIVLLGTEPRAIGLIEVYSLAERGDVALSDRRPGRDAGEAHGHRVWSFDALALDGLEAVVVTEDPIDDYAEALRFLETKGIPPELIATAAQPGRAHRALSRVAALPPERNRRPIGVPRGVNALWTRGGLQYAPPLR